RNGVPYLRGSLASLLEQTFENTEVIVIDDGSTDGSCDLVTEFTRADRRVRFERNRGEKGIAHALNLGIALVRGVYIGRLDADDYALPTRIERQVSFLKEHDNIALVGTDLEMMDESGNSLYLHHEPKGWLGVWFHTLFGTPFAHPSMLIRSHLFATRSNG